ncbi:DUF4747 family protein [Thalassotalea euphylliae]|uniref:DUF4747 family protein n=1 Tax=Thalassotalea euphylliae TaxID=1655234 RepID=A0A3E0TRU0_9GAMM|nr:DUF4747 family protein [Thalassotalea euphylliae]REL27351.1 DUF4747 family protein [Thalassotalea euphylliae]
MAVFYYFNVQVLPDSKEHGFIGKSGYKQIFTYLSQETQKNMSNKTIGKIAVKLKNDFYFAPVKIEVKDNYAQGYFRKFDQITSLKDFYTNSDVEFRGEKGLVTSKAYNFHFVFDFKKHILAISDYENRLPAPSVLEKCFEELISLELDKVSTHHHVESIILKDGTELKTLLDAPRFKSINSSITFSNPEDIEEFLEENVLERELREHGVNKLGATFMAAAKGYITGLPKVAKAILKLSTKFGDAKGQYWDTHADKYKSFALHNFPVKIPLFRNKKMSDDQYFTDIHSSIEDADNKTKG